MALPRVPGLHRFRRDVWAIGLVAQPMEDIIANGLSGAVKWCGLGRGAYLADPYGISLPDGDRLIFAERYDYDAPGSLKARGEIVAARLGRGASPETLRFAPMITSAYHMSYPSLLEAGSRWNLFVESSEAHGLSCYSAATPTGPWEFDRLILPGVPVIDPTLIAHQGRWYLFCTRLDDGPLSRLLIFTSEAPFGPWTPHPRNPVRDDHRAARPAGPIFRARDGTLYRPAQDCSLTYGGAVVIHRIDELTPQSYRESEVRRIAPVPGRWGAGLHQICALGDGTLIDGKAYEWSLSEAIDRGERGRRHAKRACEGAAQARGQTQMSS